jgi:phage FluMu gp28-like protein
MPEAIQGTVLPAVLQLRPYQQRWIDDESRFKLAVKSARIGYSYATGLEAIFDCLQHPKSTWTILSASKPQSVEFVQTCKDNIELMGATAKLYEDEDFVDNLVDTLGAIEGIVQRIMFPNGSRIIALPANARTARGYPGNAVLDEFAHHEDSYAIWAAVIRQTALDNSKLRVLSTPNGEQGKFFDLATRLKLTDGVAPDPNPVHDGPWTGHWIDVYQAVAEGCPINIAEMKSGVDDQETWDQEFCCAFLKSSGAWLPMELVAPWEDDGCTMELLPSFHARGPLFGGIDVSRFRDATVMWIDEQIGDVFWTRMVLYIYNTSFPEQYRKLDPFVRMCDRVAIDATGMGIALYDLLNLTNEGRVVGINFGGTNAPVKQDRSPNSTKEATTQSVRMKVDLAMRIKKKLEQGKTRLPRNSQVRAELMAVKKEATATGVTFDAPRIEVDSAVAGGGKKKRYAHADAFWAKALADWAADSGRGELGMTKASTPSSMSMMKGY